MEIHAELRHDVRGQQVEVRLADDIVAPAQPEVEEVRRVDPDVAPRAVLDPEHDVFQEVEQLADGLRTSRVADGQRCPFTSHARADR